MMWLGKSVQMDNEFMFMNGVSIAMAESVMVRHAASENLHDI